MTKTWKIGVADEDWKVDICRNDVERAAQAIATIEYVMGDKIDRFSGAEIRTALMKFADSAAKSVKMPIEGERQAMIDMRISQIAG